MDLKKIGQYIQMKRKDLGLTQAELAEKLGMSNKSVSKWERGVCLPDISVYTELCNLLGISLNEFIAGEDLAEDKIAKKAEENIVEIIKNELLKRNKLKQVTIGLLIISIILMCFTGYSLYRVVFPENNYLEKLDSVSEEMVLANTLYPGETAYLYKYSIDDSFERIKVKTYEYEKDELVKEEIVADEIAFENETIDGGEGLLAIIYKGYGYDAKIIASRNGFIQAHDHRVFNIDMQEMGSTWHGRLEGENVKIEKNKEYGLMAAFSNNDDSDIAYFVENIEKGEVYLGENDYTFYVTVTFS